MSPRRPAFPKIPLLRRTSENVSPVAPIAVADLTIPENARERRAPQRARSPASRFPQTSANALIRTAKIKNRANFKKRQENKKSSKTYVSELFKWRVWESNPRPQHCERCALPTELTPQFSRRRSDRQPVSTAYLTSPLKETSVRFASRCPQLTKEILTDLRELSTGKTKNFKKFSSNQPKRARRSVFLTYFAYFSSKEPMPTFFALRTVLFDAGNADFSFLFYYSLY